VSEGVEWRVEDGEFGCWFVTFILLYPSFYFTRRSPLSFSFSLFVSRVVLLLVLFLSSISRVVLLLVLFLSFFCFARYPLTLFFLSLCFTRRSLTRSLSLFFLFHALSSYSFLFLFY
jgi:hypothetical protein